MRSTFIKAQIYRISQELDVTPFIMYTSRKLANFVMYLADTICDNAMYLALILTIIPILLIFLNYFRDISMQKEGVAAHSLVFSVGSLAVLLLLVLLWDMRYIPIANESYIFPNAPEEETLELGTGFFPLLSLNLQFLMDGMSLWLIVLTVGLTPIMYTNIFA